jgi:hypothetical protein
MCTFIDSQIHTLPLQLVLEDGGDCVQAHVPTRRVEQTVVKPLVTCVWTICIATWKYLLIYK